MTVTPALARSAGGRSHKHTKSGSAINSSPASTKYFPSQPRSQPPYHFQSPPRGNVETTPPQTPKVENGGSKKKRRQRKPKDIVKNPLDQPNSSMSDSAVSPSFSERIPTTPTKSTNTPGKAYAGPTFHHSPAPSSLPVPKFFSKSVPARRAPGLQAMMEEDDSTDGSQPSSPPLDNPLEQLFRADREEKARKNRQISDNSDSDSAPDTFGRDIFGMDPDSPVRTAFNTPRNRAARPTTERSATEPMFSMDSLISRVPSSPAQSEPRGHNDTERKAKSAALRQFLFQQPGVTSIGSPTSPTSSRIPPQYSAGRTQIVVSPQGSPVPQRYQARSMNIGKPPPKAPQFNRPQYSQTRPHIFESPNQQFSNIFESKWEMKPCRTESKDFTDMENSLRQILKLDPRPNMTGGVMI